MDQDAVGRRLQVDADNRDTRRMSVLVASDGSTGALYAADWVARHCAPATVRVGVIVVRERYSPKIDSLYPMYSGLDDEADTEQWAQDAVADTVARMTPFPVAAKIRVGDPVREILAEVRQQKPDLLVVGHRGLRGLEGMVMGSVAKSLVQHSPVPVLVIPASKGDRDGGEGPFATPPLG